MTTGPSLSSQDIDPILLSVIHKRLKSITVEMGHSLLRTARSPILAEARDFVTGLYDTRGRMLEQTEYIPILAFAVSPALKHLITYFEGDVHPGDIFLHNDPFTGGNQPTDVKVCKPIFHGEELVAWAAINAHQADVGGSVAGGYNPEAREIWQECLRITPVKVYDRGKVRQDVWDLIFGNIRFEIVAQDILAAIGGCTVGERQLQRLIERYGYATFHHHADALIALTETMMANEIRQIPPGVYQGVCYAYDDGIRPDSKMRIQVTVRVEAESISFDFTGTDPQTPGFVNAPYSSTASSVMLTFLMLINPDVPHNEGLFQRIKIHVPEGTFLNPCYPAATTFGNHLADQISSAIFSALAQAIPERVSAAWCPKFSGTLVGYDPRHQRPYVDILFISSKGGSGATHGVDGYDYIGTICCAGGLIGQDPERFEAETPHFIHHFEYKPDSAGPGQWRGGYGVETEIEFLAEGSTLSTNGDGMDAASAAFGILGGGPGSPNEAKLIYPGGRVVPVGPYSTKRVIRSIPKGARWHQVAGGGGGYGSPLHRDPERVAAEVRLGLISREQAAAAYGVHLAYSGYEVDLEKTAAVRRKKEAAPNGQVQDRR